MTQSTNEPTRGLRRTITGVVTSTKMQKTITVQVRRTYKHPKYKKYVRETRRVHAHDGDELAKVGDVVELASTRPLSKSKRWRLVRVVEVSAERGLPEGELFESDVADVTGAHVAEGRPS